MLTRTARDERLTTSPEAAAAYHDGLDAPTAEAAMQHYARALALDPTFALAHALLALAAQRCCAPIDIPARLRAAEFHARRSTTAERRHVRDVIDQLTRR
ncbi:hypothetical protein ABIE44_000010 [Marmoricola sp. OAE513]|uniref:hypothetical protein n=1 Tax=Marmoricola sp. OAE513 TaxID=2817894 RepID=UPI001AE1193E